MQNLVSLALLVALLGSSGTAQRMIACDGLNRTLYEIDPATGAKTSIGVISATVGTPAGLTFDPWTETVYLTSSSLDSLYRLDVATGAATLVGPYGDSAIVMHSIEWNSGDSRLYGVSSHNNGLYRISTTNGAATLVGTSGLTGFPSLGYRPASNVMYLTDTATRSLYTVDRITGATTLVGPLGVAANSAGLAFNAHTGTMYLIDSTARNFYSVDLGSGAATLIGPTGVGLLLGLVYLPREDALPFTITSACTPNVVYRRASYASSSMSTGGRAELRCAGATGQNQLFQSDWWYRIDNDPREYVLNLDPTSGLRAEVIDPAGDRATVTWVNCDNRDFRATLEIQVHSTGPNSGVASETLTILNTSTFTRTFHIFHYADFDACGAANTNQAAFVGTPTQLQISDASCLVKTYHLACNYSNYETGSYTALRAKLADATVTNLNNTGAPFGPGDMANAYQWAGVRMGSHQYAQYHVGLGCDRQIQGCAAATNSSYCSAKTGTNGPPIFRASGMFVGGETTLVIEDGFPGSAPLVLLGVPPRFCIPIPPFGSLAVNPLVDFFMAPFDGARRSSACLPVPDNAALAGLELIAQAFFADPGAGGGVAHTWGLRLTIGNL